jgi:hypothetical protein
MWERNESKGLILLARLELQLAELIRAVWRDAIVPWAVPA